jgi:hypothetical protein
MADEHLGTYLNDHLAGATAALELLDRLAESYEGSELGRFVAGLRADIEADREELADLVWRLDLGTRRTRQAAAWLAGKAADWKLRLDDRGGGAFRVFEALEALSLGIEGKRLLWRALAALAALAEAEPDLQGLDYGRLIARAEEQRSRVEEARLNAAAAALIGTPAAAQHIT